MIMAKIDCFKIERTDKMSKLPNIEKESGFSWQSIGNIEEGRKNMGPNMPVFAYRLFGFALKDELVKQYGNEKAVEIFRNAGKSAGFELANNVLDLNLPVYEFLAQLQDVFKKNNLGILRIEEFNSSTGGIILTVAEDADCSGLPVTGETVCSYDEGILSGILEAYTKKEYIVVEVDCWATGARVCRFEGYIKGKIEE